MAWDDHSDRVCGARACDSAYGGWLADLLRDLRVGASLSAWDLFQRFPYTALEDGGANIKRQFQRDRVFGHLRQNLLHHRPEFSFIAAPFGCVETRCQLVFEFSL